MRLWARDRRVLETMDLPMAVSMLFVILAQSRKAP